jgi:hypothetical protein
MKAADALVNVNIWWEARRPVRPPLSQEEFSLSISIRPEHMTSSLV